MAPTQTRFSKLAGIEVPLICGAMYPCSNPELVAAVSEAGGIGIIQPLSMVYVYGYEFRAGMKHLRSLTSKPLGFNAIIEKGSKVYEERMRRWIDIALEEGVRFFITALGNPRWVIDRVKPAGGVVFHDITERKWALKAVEAGVDGLICVNNRAGGHAGRRSPQELLTELRDLNLPLICAGGVGDEAAFVEALNLGYDGVQMGTRFIATTECRSHEDYKNAILKAESKDIVHTERVTGVPLAVIQTPYVEKVGLKVGPLSRMLFRNPRTRHWIRMLYNVRAVVAMKRSSLRGLSSKDYWQAGKSVDGIDSIRPAGDIVRSFAEALRRS
jgi:nitronate monooxygenase